MVQGGAGVEQVTAGNAKTVTTLKKQLATKVKEDRMQRAADSKLVERR